MSKLKIAYFGDGPWSHAALLEIIKRKDDFEIVFVAPRFDNRDPELCRLAKLNGLEVKLFENVNSFEVCQQIRACAPDIIVSMSFNQILKEQFLSIPSVGTVNCHAGALPKYRGRNILNWALINGEIEFGVTAHFVDTGIDTGDIIYQEMVPIGKDAKYADVLALAYEVCPRVLVTALDQLRQGTAAPVSQEKLGRGFYCGRREEGDEWIDWSWTAERIVNFVRAISPPGPGAMTTLEGQVIVVLDASFVSEDPAYICTEGQVVGRDQHGVWVKASDRIVRLERCRNHDNLETYQPNWRIGTRLLNKQEYRLNLLDNNEFLHK